MKKEELIDALRPITKQLKTMDLNSPSFVADMERFFPQSGDSMMRVTKLALVGMEEGKICDRINGDLCFSRVSKSSEDTNNLSIDAVHMSGEGPEHTHPEGEVSFCISTGGDPDFDGFKPGWAICRPGSTHVPTVTGGTMLILYFLPNGSVIWKS